MSTDDYWPALDEKHKCAPPHASRRRRHSLWICPGCGQGWTLIFTNKVPYSRMIACDGAMWTWWPSLAEAAPCPF